MDDPVAVLAREAASLVARLRLWTPARFAAAAGSAGTRGDLVHHLAQQLADDAAAAEGLPARPLPRLDDLMLADQLAVTADDLVRSAPAPAVAVAAACHVLVHRLDLLGEPVPDGLAHSLDTPDVLQAGRGICRPTRDETGTRALEGGQGAAPEAPRTLGDA